MKQTILSVTLAVLAKFRKIRMEETSKFYANAAIPGAFFGFVPGKWAGNEDLLQSDTVNNWQNFIIEHFTN